MKRLYNRKSIGTVALIIVLTMVLTACGGGGSSSTKEILGSDGSKIQVPSSWKKIDDDEAIREMFNTDVTDVSYVILAAESDTGRLTVEKYDIDDYYNEFITIVDEIKASGQSQDKAAMLAELESIGYTEFERGFLGRIIDDEELTEEEMDQFFQEYYFQDWNIMEGQSDPGYKYIGTIDTTINGKPARIHEYSYEQEGNVVRMYETDIKDGSNIYINIAWGYEDVFNKNKDELKKILESFTY